MTKGKALPPEVLEQIVRRTDGVPLFIEELTKTVLESGLLREAGDHYELTGRCRRLPFRRRCMPRCWRGWIGLRP